MEDTKHAKVKRLLLQHKVIKTNALVCQDDDFDSTTGLLTGSMNRINHMVGSAKNNRKLMCYISLGLVILFIVLYYIVSHFTGGGS